MDNAPETDFVAQARLVKAWLAGLRNQGKGRSVRLIETHISWVLLAGRYAYKIKKAVNLGFLDFTSLQARQFYCAEEIRLNRRLAPKIYLDVIAIGGSRENPLVGAHPVVEYAVKMRRFAISRQFDRLLARHKILPQHIDSLATTISQFHGNQPAAEASSTYGTAETVRLDAMQNFEQLGPLLDRQVDLDRLAEIHKASEREFIACRNLFEDRRAQGFVRECHGDLHLGNIVLVDQQAMPFDCIEFNSALRWIDVMSEIAFSVMDLQYHQCEALAYRFLNAYVEATGDFPGIRVLHFYMAYRAMVRAKVSAIRATQPDLSRGAAKAEWASCRAYMDFAASCFATKRSALIITHGLPGSGKTTFSQIALERLQAIRLRSDVERKRMFGLKPLADSQASIGIDLYSEEITHRTYLHMVELARMLLLAGYTVIVDAAFPKQAERELFCQLAQELRAGFVIATIQASTETLRTRIVQRHLAANDASEADIEVLEKLLITQQTLTAAEQAQAVNFVNEDGGLAADSRAWDKLHCLLNE